MIFFLLLSYVSLLCKPELHHRTMKAWVYLNCSCQCVGRCSLYLLASLYPFLAALQCISPKGFLTRHAAIGQHIVKEVWGGGLCVEVCGGGGGGCFTLCWHPPRCVKAPCVSPAISLPGMGLSQSARFRGQEAGTGKVCVDLLFCLCEDQLEF